MKGLLFETADTWPLHDARTVHADMLTAKAPVHNYSWTESRWREERCHSLAAAVTKALGLTNIVMKFASERIRDRPHCHCRTYSPSTHLGNALIGGPKWISISDL